MKILKKSLLIVLITLIVMYIPISVKATTYDDKILEEAQSDYVLHINSNNEGIALLESFTETTMNFPATWRSIRYSITRTEGSSGISMAGINYGSNYVDVCIFERGTTNVIGYTKTIRPYASPIALIWTNSELLSQTREVDLFFTMYKQLTNPMTVDVIY